MLMCFYFFHYFPVIRNEEQSGNQSQFERPAGQSSEKTVRLDRSNGMAHGYYDTVGSGSSQCGVSGVAFDLGGRWPHQDSTGKISAPHLHPAHCQAAVISPCPLCASQFPVSCAVKSYPWNRIIVENIQVFSFNKSLVFFSMICYPGSKTWPMLTHLTLNTRYY